MDQPTAKNQTTGGHALLTLEELASYLRISRKSIYRLAVRGDLPGKKIVGRWRFHMDDIRAWLRYSTFVNKEESKDEK